MMKKLKKSLGLKILALCVASAGFMCVKSSMPSVEVYAMDGKLMAEAWELGDEYFNMAQSLNARFQARPGLGNAFYNVQNLWMGNDIANVVKEVGKLIDGEEADIDVIGEGVTAYRNILNNFPNDRDLMVSWWLELVRSQVNNYSAVIANEEVRSMLLGLYEHLVHLGLIRSDDSLAQFKPIMQNIG